jgi:hypothetical protein
MFQITDTDQLVSAPAENYGASTAFLAGELDQQPKPGVSESEELPAIVAESLDAALGIPKAFDESLFLSASFPKNVLAAHANTMTEEEVRDFVNETARAANAHGAKLVDILRIAEPYILREREFYNKQGQRNAQGKTWTDRKGDLAAKFGTSLRTFERALSAILKTALVSYEVSIPGLVEGLELKVRKDRLPDIKLIMDRAVTLSATGEERDVQPVTSPAELWQLMDQTLKDQIDNVLFVDDPNEFAVRLQKFAQAVADNFFPGSVVEVTAPPTEESQGSAV